MHETSDAMYCNGAAEKFDREVSNSLVSQHGRLIYINLLPSDPFPVFLFVTDSHRVSGKSGGAERKMWSGGEDVR